MFKNFKPDMYYKDIFSINYSKLRSKGVRCLLFDLDNTIEPIIISYPDSEDIRLFSKLKIMGFKVIIMSNSKKSRVVKFAKKLGVDYNFLSAKPFIKAYLKLMYKYNFKSYEIAAIGDQLMTDVYGANNAKIVSVLIDPISNIELKKTKINRLFEKFILSYLKNKTGFEKGNYYE